MKEKGTAADDGTSGEVISQAEHDAEYAAALEESAPAPKEEGGTDDATDKGNEAGDGAPPEEEATPAKEDVAQAEAEEKELKKALGLDETLAVPKELVPHLRKVREGYDKLQNERNRAGSQNKQLSEQYQTVKQELDKLINKQSAEPATRLKTFKDKLGKMDLSKLPEQTRNLLQDDEYLMTQIAVADAMNGTEDRPAHDTAAPEPAMTDEQAKASIESNIHSVMQSQIIKDSHPDIGDVYGSPDFQTYAASLSQYEQIKIFSADPMAHKEVLDRYKTHVAARESVKARETERQRKNGALKGLGSTSGGGRQGDDLTDDDILNMSPAEFKKLDQRVTSGGR